MPADRQSLIAILRYLRIAFSATCGILCLLLLMLWVRSYSLYDQLRMPLPFSSSAMIDSNFGRMQFRFHDTNEWPHLRHWNLLTSSAIETDSRMYPFIWFSHYPPWQGLTAISHWFLVLLSGTLAVIPWVRSFRWRFSLRTLLIALTIAAVLLGVLVLIN